MHCVAEDDEEFIHRTLQLLADCEERRAMGRAARENMNGVSWDAAFEMTYAAYRYCHHAVPEAKPAPRKAVLAAPRVSPRKAGAASS